MFNSIQSRLTTAFVTLVVSLLLILGAALIWQCFRIESKHAIAIQNEQAKIIAHQSFVFYAKQSIILSHFNLIKPFEKGNRSWQIDRLSRMLAERGAFKKLRLLDNTGKELVCVDQSGTVTGDGTADYSDNIIFKAPMSTGTSYYSQDRFDEETGLAMITVAEPIFDAEKKIIEGVLVAHTRIDRVWWRVKQVIPSIDIENVYLLNPNNKVVTSYVANTVPVYTPFNMVKASGLGRNMDNKLVVWGVRPFMIGSREYTIVTEIPLSKALAFLFTAGRMIILFTIAAGLLAVVVGVVVARRIVRPIEELTSTVEAIEGGDLSRRAEIKNKGETGRLARAFNSMTERLGGVLEKLEQDNKYLELLMKYSTDGININWRDSEADKTRLLFFSNRFVEMSGRSRDELAASDDFREFTHDYRTDEEQERDEQDVQRGLTCRGLASWIRPDGKENYHEWTVARVKVGDKFYLIGIDRDITEQKLAERQRSELMEVLAEKNKELENIIHVVSHDLRTPLINISGFSKELTSSCDKIRSVLTGDDIPSESKAGLSDVLGVDVPEAVKIINLGVSNISSLLDDLLRIAKIGYSAARIETLDMSALMVEVVRMVEFQSQRAGAKIQVGQLPDCVGDRLQINQVFSNLVSNAIKYLDPDRKPVVKISGYTEDKSSVYCIQDNGVGVAAENVKDIFKMFYRVDPSTDNGQGVGLAIVKQIVARHHGKVWAESQPGKGSRFFVKLPQIYIK